MRKWPTSVAVAIPLLLCSVATCQEAIPDNAAPPANLFGIQRGNQTEVFVASDVSKKVKKAVKDTLAVAVDMIPFLDNSVPAMKVRDSDEYQDTMQALGHRGDDVVVAVGICRSFEYCR